MEDVGKREKVRPCIGIVNTWNEISLSNCHLREISRAVGEGILEAGGDPFEFQTIAVSDGFTFNQPGMRYVLASRELIADSIEAMAASCHFDGLVFLAAGDKPIPAAMMAMLRLNLPSILVTGGFSAAQRGEQEGMNPMDLLRGISDYRTGMLTEDFIQEAEETAVSGAGDGDGMYTPNSMACLAEALGLSLPYSATIPANTPARLQWGKRAGRQVCTLVEQGLRPRDIVTPQALENAVALGMALGVSTNGVLHLLAIARAGGLALSLQDFQQAEGRCPLLCPITPNGPFHFMDLHNAGGIPAVMRQMGKLLHPEPRTVTGLTLGENIAQAEVFDETVIRPRGYPLHPWGGLRIIYGNLAPMGAVTRPQSIHSALWRHRGPARVFSREEDAVQALYGGGVERGDIIVLTHQGPRGGPGMQEVYGITSAITRLGLRGSVLLLTDGRFNGANFCACIGHICPEAVDRGWLAAVRDGDMIKVDIQNGRVDLELEEDTVRSRLDRLPVFQPPVDKGYLGRYIRQVGPASEGAVLGRDG